MGDTFLFRASHLRTLQLRSSIWDYEGYGKVDSLSFGGKNKAQGKKELTIGRQILVIRRTLLLRAVEPWLSRAFLIMC